MPSRNRSVVFGVAIATLLTVSLYNWRHSKHTVTTGAEFMTSTPAVERGASGRNRSVDIAGSLSKDSSTQSFKAVDEAAPTITRTPSTSQGSAESQGEQQEGSDNSVVGKPFSLPVSIEASCKKYGSSSYPKGCDSMFEALAAFAGESRDTPWADDSEQRLKTLISKEEGDATNLRQIECRSTLCVTEVASPLHSYRGLSYYDAVGSGLGNMIFIWGYEGDSPAARIVVSLTVYCRRGSNTVRPC